MMTHPDSAAVLASDAACSEPNASTVLGDDDRFLTTGELATLIHVDPSTLRRWRNASKPVGPAFTPISARVVVYSIADVRRWIATRRVTPAEGA